MKVITHNDIMNLNIDPKQCLGWVSEMLENKHSVILPAKISMKPTDEVFYNVMPSLLPQHEIGGVKVVNRYPQRTPVLDSQILLYDFNTGELKALIDGNYITTMRTGAVAVHSIKLFSKSNFRKIGMIGLGNQARATIKILLSEFPDKEFVFKLFKYKDQHKIFQDYVQSLYPESKVDFIYCDTYQETVRGSEVIISSATYLASDICPDDCYEEGCLVIPIHTRGFMNCDLFFDKVYADDTDHVHHFKYFDKFKKYAEVSDVLTGTAEGRLNDKERILVYNIGLSMHDLYFSHKIFELAEKQNIGQELSLDSPSSKFWI